MDSKKPETYLKADVVEKCKVIMAYREVGKTFSWINKKTGWFCNENTMRSWFAQHTKAYKRYNVAGKESYKYRFRTIDEIKKYASKPSGLIEPKYPISDFEREEFESMLKKAVQNQKKRYAKDKVYALYDGDKNLADGTISQIAKKMGLSEAAIRWYRTPTCYRNRLNRKYSHKKGCRYLIEL